jgi:hypothetical protein
MRPRKYPLAPLEKLRRERVDSTVKGLASAIVTHEEAERQRLELERERALLAREASAVRDAEARALVEGRLSVADLQRQGAWVARQEWEDAERGRAVSAARDREGESKKAEERARADVAAAEAEARVVERHHERWNAAGRRASELAEEEGAAEAWRPRR